MTDELLWPAFGGPSDLAAIERLSLRERRLPASPWMFLPEGEIGTLVMRGPNVFPGYVVQDGDAREIRADGKVVDGWLDTGDLAAVDADGFIRLAGRAKDLIIRGGHNIDPAAIEILVAHSDHDDEVRAALSQYAWTWRLTSHTGAAV